VVGSQNSKSQKKSSGLDPHLVAPHLAPEPMDRLAADRRAAAGVEAELPAVERANDLAVLDPADAERAAGMGAAVQKRVEPARVLEDGNPQAVHLDR
jgi:hypothetical protein